MKTKTANQLASVLLILGCSAMAGHILNIPSLKGLGLASHFAPYPKVFCQAKTIDTNEPYETFAAEFILHYHDSQNIPHSLAITPEIYAKVKGPYNRRNVYGAVLAYGPALPREIREATFQYALETPGPMITELGLPEGSHNFKIEIISRSAGSDSRWILSRGEIQHAP